MDENESKKLAEASAHVASFYTTIASPKQQAWIALMMVLGGIYGSRGVAYWLRLKAEKEAALKQRQQEQAADPRVVPMHNTNFN